MSIHTGIHSTTIQPEFIEIEALNSCSASDGISTSLNISGKEEGCVLDCPNIDENCVKATCCQNNNNKVIMSFFYMLTCSFILISFLLLLYNCFNRTLKYI